MNALPRLSLLLAGFLPVLLASFEIQATTYNACPAVWTTGDVPLVDSRSNPPDNCRDGQVIKTASQQVCQPACVDGELRVPAGSVEDGSGQDVSGLVSTTDIASVDTVTNFNAAGASVTVNNCSGGGRCSGDCPTGTSCPGTCSGGGSCTRSTPYRYLVSSRVCPATTAPVLWVEYNNYTCTQCDPGYAGQYCQFSDALTCNGHGTVTSVGTCTQCDSGYAGDNCQFSDEVTCDGRGVAQSNGTCELRDDPCNGIGTLTTVNGSDACICPFPFAPLRGPNDAVDPQNCSGCVLGRKGPSCGELDPAPCSMHGTPYNEPIYDGAGSVTGYELTCGCDYPFTGDYAPAVPDDPDTYAIDEAKAAQLGCSACVEGLFGSECRFSAEVNCNSAGTISSVANLGGQSETPICACYEGFGYAGPACEFSDAEECNGRGIVNDDGECLDGSGDSTCDQTESRHSAGLQCEYTDAETCRGNGVVDAAGNCECRKDANNRPLFVGPNCQFGREDCSRHGMPEYFAAVEGSGGVGPREERVRCRCDFVDPDSDSNVTYLGDRCQYSDADTCNNNGTVDANGGCSCREDAAGSPLFYGQSCFYSRATCNDHGTPEVEGSGASELVGCLCDPQYAGRFCECSDGRTGVNCLQCERGYARVATAEGSGVAVECLRCPGDSPDGPCSGWSVCTVGTDGSGAPDAVCDCPEGYFGSDCRLTAADCNDNGTPSDAVGSPGVSCDCYPGWRGEACADVVVPVPPCSGRGALLEGVCLCEQGWEGEVCDAPTCGNGQLDPGEGCDVEAPGCTVDCLVERGYSCGLAGRSCILDSDLDGVEDGIDNCLEEPNTDQADGDEDGSGDACDPYVPVVEEDTAGDTEVDTGIDASLDSSPPVTSEPPSGCSAGGNGSGWLAGLLLLAVALLRRHRAGASMVLAATVGLAGLGLAGCEGLEVVEGDDAGGAAVDTGLFGEEPQSSIKPGAGATTPPSSSGDRDVEDFQVPGSERRAGNLDFLNYRTCSNNLDCPNGMGSCLKEVALNRAGDGSGEGGGGAIAVNRMPGFTGLLQGQGICTLGCTDHAEVCDSLRYGDDTTPWSCQLTFKSDSPYKTVGTAPLPPAPLNLTKMTAGIQYAAVCRPPFARSIHYNRDFCDDCSKDAPCFAKSACIDVAPNAPGAAEERGGMCLSPCFENSCPSGFECRALTRADKAIGATPQAGKYCAPVSGACGACLDADGDGYGVGSCSEQGTASGVDCDETNPKRYFDALHMDHAFPTDTAGCSPLKDVNCNGKGDDVEQIEATDELGNARYGNKFCGACGTTCEGAEGTGVARATKVCTRIAPAVGSTSAPTYSCDLTCDSPDLRANCSRGGGCETAKTDAKRLYVRDCDGDGEADASAVEADLTFACTQESVVTNFETAGPQVTFEGDWEKAPTPAATSPAANSVAENVPSGSYSFRSAPIPRSQEADYGSLFVSRARYRVAVVQDNFVLKFRYKTQLDGESRFIVNVSGITKLEVNNDTGVWINAEIPLSKGEANIEFLFTTRLGMRLDQGVWIDNLTTPLGLLVKDPLTNRVTCPSLLARALTGGGYGRDCDDHNLLVKPGATEICDLNIDNNCDGEGDRGVQGVGLTCPYASVARSGVCKDGVSVCGAAGLVCAPLSSAVEAEVSCDGLDEDCDGSADNFEPGTVLSLPTGIRVELADECTVTDSEGADRVGECAKGRWQCNGGVVTCKGPEAEGTDSFGDDLDTNCDGIDGVLAEAIFVRNGGATVQAGSPPQAWPVGNANPNVSGWASSQGPTGRPLSSWSYDGSQNNSPQPSNGSYKSGEIPDTGGFSTLTREVTLDGVGELTFWVKTSTERYYDVFTFAINGVVDPRVRLSGVTGWLKVVRTLPAGRSTISFTYTKDFSLRDGDDAVWLTDIEVVGPDGGDLGTRENPLGNMTAALKLVDQRANSTTPVKQIHIAGSSDPYPMPYGLRLSGVKDQNFAIVGGYDVNRVGSGAAAVNSWIPGTGATRLVFSNTCPDSSSPNNCTSYALGDLPQDKRVAAIEVYNPVNVWFRKVSIEVPVPVSQGPSNFGSVVGISCRVTNFVYSCAGLTLDRVTIRMEGGAAGKDGALGEGYTVHADDALHEFYGKPFEKEISYPGNFNNQGGCTTGRYGYELRVENVSGQGTAFYFGTAIGVPGADGGVLPSGSGTEITDAIASTLAGKRGAMPVASAAGGTASSVSLPWRLGNALDGYFGRPGAGGGGGGKNTDTLVGAGGGAGGCGGRGGSGGSNGGSVFGIVTDTATLPTMLMVGIEMGPGGPGGSGGGGGEGQQGGWAQPISPRIDTGTGKIVAAAFVPPGGAGGSGGGGGGGAGGAGGWSVGIAKFASTPLPFTVGVSIAGNVGRGGTGGQGGTGGAIAPMPSFVPDSPVPPSLAPTGGMGAMGLPGRSVSTCAMGTPGPGDVACY